MEFKAEILHLAALRQSKGISLETIAGQTKISPYYLRAIEDLDLDKLPAGVYRENFLTQYASAINEDLAEELSRKLRKAAREAAESADATRAAQGLWRSAKEHIARGAALLLLCGTPSVSFAQTKAARPAVLERDPRHDALLKFWQKYKCPIENLTADFIAAADRHGLDWRLLPSIVFVESSGGKHGHGFNMMGWGSGKIKFRSAREAIFHVSERLAKSPIYAGKDIRTKLRIYNPANTRYADRVQEIMRQMGPVLLATR